MAGELSPLKRVLVSWNLKGPYESVQEEGMSCGVSGEIKDWLRFEALDTPRPYEPNYNNARMYCDRLEEYPSGWFLQCKQLAEAWLIGRYWHYLDISIYKEHDSIGTKGVLRWTIDFIDLEEIFDQPIWCLHTWRITDERPGYEWK